MAFAQDIRHADNGIAARFNALVANVKLAARRRAVYNQTFNELSLLSDRDLMDLGFHRSNIPAISRSAADLI